MNVTKLIQFSPMTKLITGTVLRVATSEDKRACGVPESDDCLIVDFTNEGIDFRGIWLTSAVTVLS